jgi:phage-related protein
MAIDVFDFIHTANDQYPQNSINVKFGGGYQYSSYPTGPDQIIFTLSFQAMQFYLNAGNVDATILPRQNMKALMDFYERNGTYKTFIYPHPVRGYVFVKFESPLQQPKTIKGGNGVTEPFEIKLILQP